jgi:hypothetical protein
MTESNPWHEQMDEIELMIRAARDYVHASTDLRPRVLETARAQCGEQRVRRYIRQMAIAIFLFVTFTASNRDRLETETSWITADSDYLFSRAEAEARRGSDVGWSMVEAFTESRRRQAEVLRLAL